ncbi:uncharacterized protein LOC109724417 [Ananas comosus]|uniref:Uncharacterized protein LOC109724417 n=1 Tax=Ananas comosus TaxID=4615 RepID=A0A6P5GSF2_ANACO|nr:uncharacterized protein LOC109724417 [Ananas comosus]
MNSLCDIGVHIKLRAISGSSPGSNQLLHRSSHRVHKNSFREPRSLLFFPARKYAKTPLATDSNKAATESTSDSSNVEKADDNGSQFQSYDTQLGVNGNLPQPKEVALKKPPLTARERLRAARVLSKYTESESSKPEFGSKVLDAIRESDKGKKRSGLPEAPTNLFDDSKRGLPKQGLSFDFLPVGTDVLVIAFSFVFISTVMFATTYLVWKVGAIHFNEY